MRIHKTLVGLAIVLVGSGLLAGTVMAEGTSDFRPPFMHGGGPGMMGPGMMGQGMMGMGASARFGGTAAIDALKSDLAITAAQEPAWNAYAKTLQEQTASMQAMRQGVDPDGIRAMSQDDRAKFMSQMMEQRQAHFDKLKAAAETLLPSLTDFQKGKASATLPGLASPGSMQAGMGGPMMGRGHSH